MWYSKTVEAGATDVLSGDIEIKETFNQTVQSLHRSFYGGGAMPNFESIYKYLSEGLNKLKSDEPSDLRKQSGEIATHTIRYLIRRYTNPDDKNKANRLFPLLVSYSEIAIQTPAFEEVTTTLNGSNPFNISNFIYSYGYVRLISLFKEGILLPYGVRFYIASNLDILSSQNLKNVPERQELKQLIIEKDPYLKLFDHDKYDSKEIMNNFAEVGPWEKSRILERSGLSIEDVENFLVSFANSYQFKEGTGNFCNNIGTYGLDTWETEIIIRLFKIYHKIKDKIDERSYRRLVESNIRNGKSDWKRPSNFPQYVDDVDFINIVKDDISIWKSYIDEDEARDFYCAIGAESEANIIKYFLSMKKDTRFIAKAAVPTNEEIAVYESKNENKEEEDKIGDDLFDICVSNGDITLTDLNDPKYSKIVDDIANALGYTENENDILKFIKNAPIVTFNNNNFYKKLELKKPPVLGSFQMSDLKALGIAKFPFFLGGGKGYSFGLQINKFLAEKAIEGDNILSSLNIDTEKFALATVAHEITHILDSGIKGGPSVFGNLDPTQSLKKDEVFNKSRLYLSDIREIVARIYGNSAFIAEHLHQEVDGLRTNKDIREAAISELSDMLMRNPASWMNLTPMIDENTLQHWAEMKFGPYQQSQKPYTDATKTFLRQKEKARDFYLEAGKRQRRDILLKFLKELNSLKRQLESINTNLDDSQIEIKKQIEQDIATVNKKIKTAQEGGYDHDINLVISAVANYVAFRGVQITDKIASDPSFDPNTHLTIPGHKVTQAIGDSTPLSFQELREIRDFDLARLSEGEEGGVKLREKKPSFMSFDIYNPEWREDFRKTYDIQPENEKTSFNYSKWLKN